MLIMHCFTSISLSRGCFQVGQVLKMELCIFKSLHWRLHPPSPFTYLTVACPLLEESASADSNGESIMDVSTCLIELSVYDVFFVDKKPSSITCAAILVAMDILSIPKKGTLLDRLDNSPEVTKLCKRRLREVYNLALEHSQEEEGIDSSASDSCPRTAFWETCYAK